MTQPRTIHDVARELIKDLIGYHCVVPFAKDSPVVCKGLSLMQQKIDSLISELRHMAPAGTHWYNELVAQIESAYPHNKDLLGL